MRAAVHIGPFMVKVRLVSTVVAGCVSSASRSAILLLDSIERLIRAQEQGVAGHGGRGKEFPVELILREHLERLARRDETRGPFAPDENEFAVCVERRSVEIAPEALAVVFAACPDRKSVG